MTPHLNTHNCFLIRILQLDESVSRAWGLWTTQLHQTSGQRPHGGDDQQVHVAVLEAGDGAGGELCECPHQWLQHTEEEKLNRRKGPPGERIEGDCGDGSEITSLETSYLFH